jgi:hypothetical protein
MQHGLQHKTGNVSHLSAFAVIAGCSRSNRLRLAANRCTTT